MSMDEAMTACWIDYRDSHDGPARQLRRRDYIAGFTSAQQITARMLDDEADAIDEIAATQLTHPAARGLERQAATLRMAARIVRGETS